nr:YlmH/Sll1252 family protein [uncultured Mogibacterium sp.]
MDNDKIITARIEDKLEQCERGNYITTTGFLNMHEQALAMHITRGRADVKSFFYGGYEDAERRILMFIPEGYADTLEEALEMISPLSVLHIKVVPSGRKLTHRDYLGSVLSLGLDRSVIGDILVNEKGADMIVNSEIVNFLLSEFHSAGHTNLQITISDIGELEVPEQRVKAVRDTLSSPRLDNVVSTAFHVSRSEAVRAIKGGIVFVNHEEVTKIDKRINEGDMIVLRGKGKAILSELSGLSKKGRIWAEFKVFI